MFHIELNIIMVGFYCFSTGIWKEGYETLLFVIFMFVCDTDADVFYLIWCTCAVEKGHKTTEKLEN